MSLLEGKLRLAHFVVTTELTPPKGIDLSEFFAKADALKSIVDAINITESPRARMAVEPKSVAHLLQDRGIEAIVQITARDRNRIAIQADLLGACLLGIGNFLFMTGDDPKNGDHPEARGVFDLTTIELLSAARSQFFQTQAIYYTVSLARFVDAANLGTVPLLAGIIPLKSAKMGV